MRRDPVALAWLGGLALAAALYLVGTDRFWFQVLNTLHVAGYWVGEFVADLSGLTIELVRALALGVFATFVALCWLVARRGAAVRGTGLLVALLFLVLAGSGGDGIGDGAGGARWAGALLVAGVGAGVMTRRLRAIGAVTTVGQQRR